MELVILVGVWLICRGWLNRIHEQRINRRTEEYVRRSTLEATGYTVIIGPDGRITSYFKSPILPKGGEH